MNMKIRIVLASSLLFIGLIGIRNVQATSGACSWHIGVDCSAGADYDGSVICKDGWRDSSVSYRDNCATTCPYGYTDEFKQMLVSCLRDQTTAETEFQSRQDTLRANILRAKTEMYNILNSPIPDNLQDLDPRVARSLRDQQLQGIAAEIRNYESALTSEKQDAMAKCKFLDSTSYLYCKNAPILVAPPIVVLPKPVVPPPSVIAKPVPSKPKPVTCSVGTARSLDGKNCVSIPEHAHAVQSRTDVWKCDEGYVEQKDQCVVEIVAPSNAQPSPSIENKPPSVPKKKGFFERIRAFFTNK